MDEHPMHTHDQRYAYTEVQTLLLGIPTYSCYGYFGVTPGSSDFCF